MLQGILFVDCWKDRNKKSRKTTAVTVDLVPGTHSLLQEHGYKKDCGPFFGPCPQVEKHP